MRCLTGSGGFRDENVLVAFSVGIFVCLLRVKDRIM